MKNGKWNVVTASEPCPGCGKSGWCRRSPDGSKVACRREATGAVKTKRYKDGSLAYIHISREEGLPSDKTGPARTRPGKTTASTSTATDRPFVKDSPTTVANTQNTAVRRDAGYRCLLAKLSLSSDHRESLRNRGLSDAAIDAGEYRTLPVAGRPSVIKRVVAELGQEYAVVPGFVMGERGPKIAAPAGLLIPVRDLEGRIVALKVRPDNPTPGKPKYVYMSSTKYGGPSPGSPVHVPVDICGPLDRVRITEGELKADVASRLSDVPTVAFPGVASGRMVLPVLQSFECKTVRLSFDADARTNKHVARALRDCCCELRAAGMAVELECWPAEAGKGIDDVLKAGREAEIQISVGPAALAAVEEIATGAGVDDKHADHKKGERKSQSTLIAELAALCELWHTSGQSLAYATVPVSNHREHWPIRSLTFKRWLGQQFFRQHGKAPSSQALQDAINVLEGQAIYEGREYPVFVRIAGGDEKVYLDLGNETWQTVEIDAHGWRVLDTAPVRFRRPKALTAVPIPMPGGNLDELRRFVNVSEDDWPLLVGWIVGALRPTGPYPILALHGEQGSAKSTTARIIRSLIDPNAAPIRCEPRDPRDLMIAANNGWIVALDNLSFVPVWLSDALCRLATGGGFATRTLYENDEETIFDSMRPAILTGIEELASRSDLLDRSLILQLPRIPDAKRKTEAKQWKEFQQVHGRILGAILDAVSAAIRNLPTTHVEELPRMADFALWATAAESGLGLQPGEFLTTYRGNRDGANETALESNPISKYVLEVADEDVWSGTSSELLAYLENKASEGDKRQKAWPKNPRSLSGALKRLAPNLRATGVEVEFGHEGRGRTKRRTVSIRKNISSCVPCDPSGPSAEKLSPFEDRGDARNEGVDAVGTQSTDDLNPSGASAGTRGDGGDATSHAYSDHSTLDAEWGEL